eukprot:212598_1
MSLQSISNILSKLMSYKISKTFATLMAMYYFYKLYHKISRYSLKQRIKKSKFQPKIIIIGAGMSGICAAYKLKQEMGYENFIILERHHSVGGTWYVNKYPGIQCDVPSVLYSYSFAQKHNWSRAYGTGEELLQYIKDVAKKFGLYKFIKFGKEVDNLYYDETNKKWHIILKDGETYECNYVIGCVGGLNIPKYPNINGIDDFKGKSIHSGEWDSNYDLTGKRVAIFGSGCSALQITPSIQPIVKKLYIIARSPTYIFPKIDPIYSSFRHNLFYYLPILMYLHRLWVFILGEIIVYPLLLKKNRKYQQRAISVFL